MAFEDLGLSAELLRAISEQGYGEPTPIQKQAIPLVLSGRDVMAAAQTGTGKTAGFTLPLLQLLSKTPSPKGFRPVRALVLTPTRELAAQIDESVRGYGKHLDQRSAVIFGGVKINPQIETLRRGVDILVATPGAPARSRGSEDRGPLDGRDPRPRRGRPDARHGLHPRHQARARAAAGRTTSVRTSCSRRRSRTTSSASRGVC